MAISDREQKVTAMSQAEVHTSLKVFSDDQADTLLLKQEDRVCDVHKVTVLPID